MPLRERHMEQRDIRLEIASDQLCRETSPIMQRHRDVGCPFHDMGVVTIEPAHLISRPDPSPFPMLAM